MIIVATARVPASVDRSAALIFSVTLARNAPHLDKTRRARRSGENNASPFLLAIQFKRRDQSRNRERERERERATSASSDREPRAVRELVP